MQRCTTSYVRLPGDYPKLLSGHRPQDLQIIWNDTWVSVTSGSEDYSFKVLHPSCDTSNPMCCKIPIAYQHYKLVLLSVGAENQKCQGMPA